MLRYERKHSMKRIETTNHLQFADLPEEIVRFILLRLPVKSILKFRCVSKSWFSFISSPQFIKSHLELSSKNANFTNQRIILNSARHMFNLDQCLVSSLMSEATVMSDVDYPDNLRSDNVKVTGSCNGIICISIDSQFVVLSNPSTRKSKELPTIPTGNRFNYFCVLGLGYSESEDDYKVVGIYFARDANEWHVQIYSLRTNSWKRIEDFRLGIPLCGDGKFASGKLHFAALSMETFTRYKYDDADIVSLDLKSEAFSILKKPNHEDGCSFTSFGLLGGCLSFLYNYGRIRADVWVVLKEYGVNESWTRVVSIPYFKDPYSRFSSPYNHPLPLIMMPNGEIVFSFESSLVVYNPSNNCVRYLQWSNPRSSCVYFESLVPL